MPSSALGSRAEVGSLIRDGLEELSRLASATASNADSIASFVDRYCDARPGDLLILHSTSGESGNLVCAVNAARAKGVPVVALLGKGDGRVRSMVVRLSW